MDNGKLGVILKDGDWNYLHVFAARGKRFKELLEQEGYEIVPKVTK